MAFGRSSGRTPVACRRPSSPPLLRKREGVKAVGRGLSARRGAPFPLPCAEGVGEGRGGVLLAVMAGETVIGGLPANSTPPQPARPCGMAYGRSSGRTPVACRRPFSPPLLRKREGARSSWSRSLRLSRCAIPPPLRRRRRGGPGRGAFGGSDRRSSNQNLPANSTPPQPSPLLCKREGARAVDRGLSARRGALFSLPCAEGVGEGRGGVLRKREGAYSAQPSISPALNGPSFCLTMRPCASTSTV